MLILCCKIIKFGFYLSIRRHSDDPLISGAIDDNQNEFDAISSCEQLSMATSTLYTHKKSPRTRRKGQVKLRFHHQALPQEYLDHYEATQNEILGKENSNYRNGDKSKRDIDGIDQLQEQKINESVQMWLQKVSEIQEEKILPAPKLNSNTTLAKKSHKVITYNDLPYMGEMTLENSKPRRGRKPKKADICHLIYKNYGTVFPNQPTSPSGNDEQLNVTIHKPEDTKKSNQSHKKLSSLLEKRLTQDKKNNKMQNRKAKSESAGKSQIEEPLNLCIRDRSICDLLPDSSEDTDENESLLDFKPNILPLISTTDLSTNSTLSSNLKMSLPNFQAALLDENKLSATDVNSDLNDNQITSPNGYVYLPSSGVFIHPMALYLQKIAEASSSFKQNQLTESTAIGSSAHVFDKNKNEKSPTHQLIPKKISQLIKEDVSMPRTSSPSLITNTQNAPAQSKPANPPPKRKRSAIFIPPMPDETSKNHATEVSICKFKFTGGAKPSLQEKKMLSVDAGGNFRYYSGTGDKSIRGYEFFPRESLKQSSLMSCSSAGAFLNTPGTKIPIDLPPPSQGLSNELLQIPELNTPPGADILSSVAHRLKQHNSVQQTSTSATNNTANNNLSRRKRKSRRSMQREKLEKTFKEKGFLIKTQQLESAEGATYCKFRQLRKFTRYLFRSWKDYLPGELQQNQNLPVNTAMHSCIENLSEKPSTSNNQPNTSNDI